LKCSATVEQLIDEEKVEREKEGEDINKERFEKEREREK
jgi:hypothetical protein